MTAMLPLRRSEPWLVRAGWSAHLAALGLLMGVILLLFSRDVADMVGIWFESSTFNHCALIAPIAAWLVWQRLPGLRMLSPRAWSPGLLLLGLGAGSWLLGEAGGVALARHFGLIVMLQGAVVTCLGKAVARALAFPLFFLLFMVPAGEEIVPVMQTVTAHMCMALLALAGIPAHIEGVFITTPGGYFEVAEACSGVEFLIAMIAYGALVANVCFVSRWRRAAFMAVAIAVPILANGIRAWGTIYIASLTGIEFAAGFDHVFYGWFFFAIVIALTMAAGWRFFDRKAGDPWFDPAALQPRKRGSSSKRLSVILAGALALVALPAAWAPVSASKAADIPAIRLPVVPGWQMVADHNARPWLPRFVGADQVRIGHYRNMKGQHVDLAVATFARQEEGREIVGFGQGDAPGWAWTASAPPPPNGRAARIASFGTIREVVTFYRIGDVVTGSAVKVKLETMKAKLLGRPERATAILVSAEAPGEGLSPRASIDAYLADLGPVQRAIDN